jgi:hypothetical protein
MPSIFLPSLSAGHEAPPGPALKAALSAPRPDSRTAASREIPMTLERAPWAIRQQLGHFGAYREGVSPLVGRLRRTFDPAGVLRVALEAEPDGR